MLGLKMLRQRGECIFKANVRFRENSVKNGIVLGIFSCQDRKCVLIYLFGQSSGNKARKNAHNGYTEFLDYSLLFFKGFYHKLPSLNQMFSMKMYTN